MPAVHPRARVRLRAYAVALTLSTSMIAGLAAGPAEATTGPVTAAAGTITTSVTGGTLVAERVAAAGTAQVEALQSAQAAKAAAKKVAAKKAAHKAALTRAAKKAAMKKAAARKAAARKAAAHRREVALRSLGARVVRVASTYKGTPYQYGAAGPRRFDCSGFTRFVYAKFGISLPHSSSGQYSVVQHIANSKKRIGDLVFFHTSGGHVYHVGIYAGGDVIWAATHTGDFVRLEGMWNASYYVGRV